MEKRKKSSFARSFTTVSLIMLLLVKLILSLVFFNYLKNVVTELSESNTKENIAHSQEIIVSIIKEHEQAVRHTAVSMSYFLRQNTPSSEFISGFLNDISAKLPHSLDIYFTNNIIWNQSGGFASFGSGWIPDGDWDNTKRPWYTDAKKAEGKIAFSQPYVDSETDHIIVTLSMTVFDGEKDIGVAANDLKVNSLREIINSKRNIKEQEIYILNSQGLFITHEDIHSVMKKDFFTEKKLDKYRESILHSSDSFIIDKNIFIYSSAIPYTDWIIISTIPSSVIFSKTNLFIIRLILFSIGMFLCVATVSIVFTYKKLTVPLNDVKKVTDALAENDVNVNISSFGDDEIGDIQLSLIKIRDSLKTNIDSLQKHLSKNE